MIRATIALTLALAASACASAPPPPPIIVPTPPTLSFEQKTASILRLENQRVLRDQAPPADPPAPVAAVPGQNTPIVPPPPPPPPLLRLRSGHEGRVRRRARAAAVRARPAEGLRSAGRRRARCFGATARSVVAGRVRVAAPRGQARTERTAHAGEGRPALYARVCRERARPPDRPHGAARPAAAAHHGRPRCNHRSDSRARADRRRGSRRPAAEDRRVRRRGTACAARSGDRSRRASCSPRRQRYVAGPAVGPPAGDSRRGALLDRRPGSPS